jgi:urease accessory protein
MTSDWLIWQVADSAFPTGGFAHSSGLEAAWQSGEVTTAEQLRQFLGETLWQAGRGSLPLVTAAHGAPERLEELDALCEAFLSNAVANAASRTQGRAFLSTCARIWPGDALTQLGARTKSLCTHYGPIAGVTLRVLDVPLAHTQPLILYLTARGVLAAAVRLGIVGSYHAQQLQYESGAVCDAVLAGCARLDDRHISQTAPILDMLQSAHGRLYSRLFRS